VLLGLSENENERGFQVYFYALAAVFLHYSTVILVLPILILKKRSLKNRIMMIIVVALLLGAGLVLAMHNQQFQKKAILYIAFSIVGESLVRGIQGGGTGPTKGRPKLGKQPKSRPPHATFRLGIGFGGNVFRVGRRRSG